MFSSRLMASIAILGILVGALGASHAAADAQNTAPAAWSSSTHLGFGVNDSSSTGFQKVAGSLAFLDISRNVDIPGKQAPRVELGLRSLGQGGRSARGEFYRLGAGPLISVAPWAQWKLQLSLQAFKETALDSQGDTAYKSRGYALMLGWERLFSLSPRLDLSWGGFIAGHQGSIEQAPSLAAAPDAPGLDLSSNHGWTRGIELGLLWRL